jgi:DNA-binding MurR/RpiR family transcriptional regulator
MESTELNTMPHSCALKLQAVYGTLKSAERKAADYLMNHAPDIHGLTIVDYAQKAGCSEATIVRLSKRLGYDGFPELKNDFAAKTADHSILDYQGLDASEDPAITMRKVLEASSRAIADTAAMVDPGAYNGALDALCSARNILFAGVGDAGVVAAEAYHRFLRIGHPSGFSQDLDIQLILASQLVQGDVLLAISHSGQTKSLLSVVREAERAGATVIAITNYPLSQLAKRATHVLQTAVFTSYVSGEVMSKRVAQLCLIESLFVNFMICKGDIYLSRLRASNEVVSQNKF